MLRGLCLFTLLTASISAVDVIPLWDGELETGMLAEWALANTPAMPQATFDDGGLSLVISIGDDEAVTRRAFAYQPFVSADTGSGSREFRPAGVTTFHVRHVFRNIGVHDLRLLDADKNVLAEWTVNIIGGDQRGPVGISPHNPRLLAYHDGTPLIPIGCNIAWTLRPDRLQKFISYLDALAANGGNHCRVWCASWFAQVQGDQPNQARLDHAWLLDQVLFAAHNRGITVTLVLDNHHDLIRGHQAPYGNNPKERVTTFLNPNLPDAYRQRLSYVIARYGACDALMAWELFNEIDLILVDQPFSKHFPNREKLAGAWADSAARFIHRTDPDQRLVTISLAKEPWAPIFEAPNIDMVALHRYAAQPQDRDDSHYDGAGQVIDALRHLERFGKPVMINEVGHHGDSNTNVPGNQEDPDGILLRHQAWAGLLAGGAGSGQNWWWDTYIDSNNLWSVYQPIAAASHLIDWTDRDLQPLDANDGSSLRVIGWRSAHQALLWPQVRADTWHAQSVRQLPVKRFRRPPMIQLPGLAPERSYRISAVDMISGEVTERDTRAADSEGRLSVLLGTYPGQEVLVVTKINR